MTKAYSRKEKRQMASLKHQLKQQSQTPQLEERIHLGMLFRGSANGGWVLKFSEKLPFGKQGYTVLVPKGATEAEVTEAISFRFGEEYWDWDGPTPWSES